MKEDFRRILSARSRAVKALGTGRGRGECAYQAPRKVLFLISISRMAHGRPVRLMPPREDRMSVAQSVPFEPESAAASPTGVVALPPGSAPAPSREAADRLASLARVAAVASIGNTPLLRLQNLAARAGLPDTVELWLKAEWTNPGGSIKDRPALAIIRAALSLTAACGPAGRCSTRPVGNTGIAYALLGRRPGRPGRDRRARERLARNASRSCGRTARP